MRFLTVLLSFVEVLPYTRADEVCMCLYYIAPSVNYSIDRELRIGSVSLLIHNIYIHVYPILVCRIPGASRSVM